MTHLSLTRRWLNSVLLGMLLAAGCDNDTRTIRVQTRPVGASVFIDGKLAGAAPCKVQWTDARPDDLWELHVIEARAKGCEPQRKEIRYRTGEAWLPDTIELILTPADGFAKPSDEPDPVAPAATWTPRKEIPAANNTPPKPDSPEVQPMGPPEPAFSIWRPKGRVRKTTDDPSPSPQVSQPANRTRKKTKPVAVPAKVTPEPPALREFHTSGTNRLLACEVRLVRLSDGRVLSQASLQGPYSRRGRMADVLVELLADSAPDDATVAVGCLSNRRRSPDGRTLCDELTRAMVRAVRRTPGLRYVKQVNLRDVILDEEMVESSKIVADRRLAYLFTGADHVIVGGAAMAIPIAQPVEQP